VPTTPAKSAPTPAQAFASQLVKDLGQIPLDRQGSSAVADQLRTQLRMKLQNPKLSQEEKLKVVGDTLKDLFKAGRGPAMQGISDFLGLAPKLGIPIDADLRSAMGDALTEIEASTVGELDEQGGAIASRAGLPPDTEGQVDFRAVRDLAQMSRTLNRGGETERTAVVMFVLGKNDKSVIGRVGSAMQDVVFKGGSKVVTFTAPERAAAQKLLKEYATADRSSRAQLERENGPLLAKLEKVAGGLMADSPRAYLNEQRDAGHPELSVMSDPLLTTFHENVNIAQTVGQVRKQLPP
jgi:hypothetical protein